MKELVNLLKKQNYQINPLLLCNYKKLKITDQELIMIIYLLNETYNPKEIAKNLDLKLPEVLEMINALSEKGLLKIELKKINNISVEVINFDNLFDSLGLLAINKENEDKDNSIYDTFERELGRTISPME